MHTMESVTHDDLTTPSNDFDTTKKFVRVIEERSDGFVEFAFAIGDPELEVELLMYASAFEEFCTINQVVMIDSDEHPAAWGLHDAREWLAKDHDPLTPPPTYGDIN